MCNSKNTGKQKRKGFKEITTIRVIKHLDLMLQTTKRSPGTENHATLIDDSNKSRPINAPAPERASAKKLRLDLDEVQCESG